MSTHRLHSHDAGQAAPTPRQTVPQKCHLYYHMYYMISILYVYYAFKPTCKRPIRAKKASDVTLLQ